MLTSDSESILNIRDFISTGFFDDPLYWSVRITRDYRAVGILEGNTITWIWIGDHKAFNRRFPA